MGALKSYNSPVARHRLMKAPLDDSEVYTSMASLMDYCKSGTAYDGQRVAVNLKYFNQEFVLRSDSNGNVIPLLHIPENELQWKLVNSDHFVMVYYYNRSGKTFSISDRFTYTEDPFAWAILEFLPIFKEDDQYTLRLEVDDYNHNESVYTVTQGSPLDVSGVNPTSATANVTSIGKRASNGNAYITTENTNIFLFPKNYTSAGSKNIIRLWVRANRYFSALGEG